MTTHATTLAAVYLGHSSERHEGPEKELAQLLAFLTLHRHPQGLTHAVVALPLQHHATLLAALPHALGQPAGEDWPQTLPAGFHRLDLGHWILTLCVGPVEESVAQWCCAAQHLWVGGDGPTDPTHPPATLARTLARHCAHHATLWLATPAGPEPAAWAAAGFVAPTDPTAAHGWRYQPRWPVPVRAGPGTRTAIVIGAGLAGAAACASLTRRGWRVTLVDAGSAPAQGASGLPVGMLSEHITARETVLSRLSRSGMALHWRELQRRVPAGKGWQASQVTRLRHGNDDDADAASEAAAPDTQPSTSTAAIVRPAVLVNAWLAQAQATGLLHACWQSPVAALERQTQTNTWLALNAQGHVLAQAAHVVVAAAFGSASLLRTQGPSLPTGDTLRPVKGQLSFAPLDGPALAPHPLRDHGVYVPCFEDSTHPLAPRVWAMGSTYERGQSDSTVTQAAHDRNAASLKGTLPTAHALFEAQRAEGQLQGWAQVRCASLDRLPLVGALPDASPLRASMQLADVPRQPGAWTLCALGSRGLTLSLLAAELLVAQMEHEPWPVEKDLALALDPARFALKHARKKPVHKAVD